MKCRSVASNHHNVFLCASFVSKCVEDKLMQDNLHHNLSIPWVCSIVAGKCPAMAVSNGGHKPQLAISVDEMLKSPGDTPGDTLYIHREAERESHSFRRKTSRNGG